MKKLYILFDGANLFYRCFFAAKGNRSQVFSIFHRYLDKVGQRFCNTNTEFVFFWDSPRNWRTKVTPNYKETRRQSRKGKKTLYEQLYFQMDLLKEKLEDKQYQIEGYEADDVISLFIRTVSEKFDKKQYFLIVSTDKDYMQLIEDNETKGVAQLKPGKNWEYVTYEKFCKLYGFEPSYYASILALMGDSSDNVKGVPGIGEKRAADLVRKYGDLRKWISDEDDEGDPAKRTCLNNVEGVKRDLRLVDLENSDIFKFETLEL